MADNDPPDPDTASGDEPAQTHTHTGAATAADPSTDQVAARVTGCVDPKLLEILVCPLTKTRLAYNAETQELISTAAGLAFPIRNGVPLLIADAGRQLTESEQDRR